MRRILIAVVVLGIFTISNAETITATGTLSIEEIKKMIILQSVKIKQLERKILLLEKELAGMKKALSQSVKSKKSLKNYCVIANLNVRKGPGLDYEVIAWLKKGSIIQGTERKGKWLKILSPSGWVSSLYLRECGNGKKE